MILLLLVVLRAVSTAPIPPYAARLLVDAAFVRGAPEERALAVGLLRLGDEVTPPRLPAGWHAIEPAPAHLPTLWVLITR